MRHSALSKLLIALTIATLATATPAGATCSQEGCVSPCTYAELLYDIYFSQGCPYWVWGTGASGGSGGATFTGNGSVYQTLTLGSYSSMQVSLEFDAILNTYDGTERLHVEVLRASDNALLQRITTFYPTTTPGRYDFNINNYSNQTVKLRFRRTGGIDAGDTTFVITSARWWAFY